MGDADPIIERLHRQVLVFACLDLDDGEAAGALDGEEIEDSAIDAGQGGHLSVDRLGEKRGIEEREVAPEDGFKPCLGIAGEQRVMRNGRIRVADLRDAAGLDGEFLHRLIGVERAGGVAREFETADAQAAEARAERDELDIGLQGEAAQLLFGRLGQRVLPGLETRQEIAVVLGIDGRLEAALVVAIEAGLDSQVAEAEEGVGLVAAGEEEDEAADGRGGLAAAKVIEPDETVGEGGIGVLVRRGDDGPAGVSVDDAGARATRRERVFEVRPGSELGHAPTGELAGEPAAEVFPQNFAGGALEGGGGLGPGEIEHRDEAGAAAELLDGQSEAAGARFVDGSDAAGECARLVPRLDEQAVGPSGEGVVIRGEGEGRLAGFKQCGLAASGEEALDLSAQSRDGDCAGRPFVGGHRDQCIAVWGVRVAGEDSHRGRGSASVAIHSEFMRKFPPTRWA